MGIKINACKEMVNTTENVSNNSYYFFFIFFFFLIFLIKTI